jgi:hypothetical protein
LCLEPYALSLEIEERSKATPLELVKSRPPRGDDDLMVIRVEKPCPTAPLRRIIRQGFLFYLKPF